MAIEIITPASDKKLTTLSHVKEEIGITDTSDDSFINRLIDEISSAIVTYTNREFAQEEVKEKVAGFGDPDLVVSRTPIQSISEVTYNDETTIDSSEYFIGSADAGFIRRINDVWKSTTDVYVKLTTYQPPHDHDLEWFVTYTGGYVLPNWADTRTLPYDVERACIEGVKARFLARQRDPNVTEQDIPYIHEAKYTQYGLPTTALQFLEPYVRLK